MWNRYIFAHFELICDEMAHQCRQKSTFIPKPNFPSLFDIRKITGSTSWGFSWGTRLPSHLPYVPLTFFLNSSNLHICSAIGTSGMELAQSFRISKIGNVICEHLISLQKRGTKGIFIWVLFPYGLCPLLGLGIFHFS